MPRPFAVLVVFLSGLVAGACAKSAPPPKPPKQSPTAADAKPPEPAPTKGAQRATAHTASGLSKLVRNPPGKMGTAHPFVFEGGSYEHDWVIGCQARKDTDGDGKVSVGVGHHGDMYGDAMQPFLFVGGGDGTAIDAYVGSDRSGRFVAVSEGGALILVDAKENTRRDLTSSLGFDPTDDNNPTLHHAALAFGPNGRLVGQKRTTADGVTKTDVILLDPFSGETKVVFSSTEMVWRVDFKPSGDELAIWVVRDDTDKNGKLEAPRARTSLSARGCRGPILSYGVYGWDNDKPVEETVNVGAGAKLQSPEVLSSPADSLEHAFVTSDRGASLIGAKGTGRLTNGPTEWVQK